MVILVYGQVVNHIIIGLNLCSEIILHRYHTLNHTQNHFHSPNHCLHLHLRLLHHHCHHLLLHPSTQHFTWDLPRRRSRTY